MQFYWNQVILSFYYILVRCFESIDIVTLGELLFRLFKHCSTEVIQLSCFCDFKVLFTDMKP